MTPDKPAQHPLTMRKTFSRRLSVAGLDHEKATELIRETFAVLRTEAASEASVRFHKSGHFNGDFTCVVTHEKDAEAVTVDVTLNDYGLPVHQSEPVRLDERAARYGDWIFNVLGNGHLEIVHESKCVWAAEESLEGQGK